MFFHISDFPYYKVRKTHERWKNNCRWTRLDILWNFTFLNRIQRDWLEATVLTSLTLCSWLKHFFIYYYFLFWFACNLILQAIQINNYSVQNQCFIYLGFSGSFSIALNASKHSLYNSSIYLRQQRTEEKYKHNIY